MRLNNIIILSLFIIAVSCIDSFVPETAKYDNILFIEGHITNDPEMSPVVYISRSIPVTSENTDSISTVSGAEIYLICNDGSEYDFYEPEPGKYNLSDVSFTAVEGNSYKLIVYYDQNTFESDFETLILSPEIDSIRSKARQQKVMETGETVYGLKLYISTHSTDPGPAYYRWILDATYQYAVPYNSTHRYIDSKPVEFSNHKIINCWKSLDIDGIFISSTEGLSENTVIDAPLNFVSQYGDELSYKYCLHAKQLSISESAYSFWYNLDKLINQTGGLYETQPFRLTGNIKCTSDPDVIVSGLFEVAGVSEKRKYFNSPKEFKIKNYICDLDTVGTLSFPWDALREGSYLYQNQDGVFLTSEIKCFDCRARGGTEVKPSWWDQDK